MPTPKHAPKQFTKLETVLAVVVFCFALVGLGACALWGAICLVGEKLTKENMINLLRRIFGLKPLPCAITRRKMREEAAKKLPLLLILALALCGCGPESAPAEYKSENHNPRENYKTVNIDGCQYLEWETYSSHALCHKGNCTNHTAHLEEPQPTK